jgi:hypothetical protein
MIKVATDPKNDSIITHYTFSNDSEVFAFLRLFESSYPDGKWIAFTTVTKENINQERKA